MKIPVGIDLGKASRMAGHFAGMAGRAGRSGSGSGFGAVKSEGPIVPFQIIARASFARSSCGLERMRSYPKVVSLSRFQYDPLTPPLSC